MFKIGEFSKLSMLTVKALRFYEKQGLLIPAQVDQWTGYRYYEASQLETAATIKALRQLDFSIEEIRTHLNGMPLLDALAAKKKALQQQSAELSGRISIINYLMEESNMDYQAVVKEIGPCIVYSEERELERYSDVTALVLDSAAECRRLNPDIECTKPDYGFCEYLDGEYRQTHMRLRYSQAVTKEGVGNARIQFRHLPATKAICIYHRGAYDRLGEAYAYIYRYAMDNGYRIAGYHRERYIDGIWNKDKVEDWLTEIQLPVE